MSQNVNLVHKHCNLMNAQLVSLCYWLIHSEISHIFDVML